MKTARLRIPLMAMAGLVSFVGAKASAASSFDCPTTYLVPPEVWTGEGPHPETVCAANLNSGRVSIYFGWRPGALAWAQYKVEQSGRVLADVWCRVDWSSICIAQSSQPDFMFIHTPLGTGPPDVQTIASFTLNGSAQVTLTLQPAFIAGACGPVPPSPCAGVLVGEGLFEIYGVSS